MARAEIAAHGLPCLPARPIDLRRGAQHLALKVRVRLRKAAAQKGAEQLVGVVAFPRLPVQNERRAAQKLRQLLRRQQVGRRERMQGFGRDLVEQAKPQHGPALPLRQPLPEGGGKQVVKPLGAALRQRVAQVFQIQRHRRRPAVRFLVDGVDLLRRGRDAELVGKGVDVAFRKQQVAASDIADAVAQNAQHVAQAPEVLGDEHGAHAVGAAFCQRVQHLRLPALQRELKIVEDQRQRLGGVKLREDLRRLLRVASVEVAQILQRAGGRLVDGAELADEPAEAVVRHALYGGIPTHRRVAFRKEPADRRGLPVARGRLQRGERAGLHLFQLADQCFGKKQLLHMAQPLPV